MDISLWRPSFDSQHFAQFVPNSFGKISFRCFLFDYIFCGSRVTTKKANLIIFPGEYFVHKVINVKVRIMNVASRTFSLHPFSFAFVCCVVNRTSHMCHELSSLYFHFLLYSLLVCTCVIHKRCKASVVTTCPGIRTCFEV